MDTFFEGKVIVYEVSKIVLVVPNLEFQPDDT